MGNPNIHDTIGITTDSGETAIKKGEKKNIRYSLIFYKKKIILFFY
jgi:hypothetical protein